MQPITGGVALEGIRLETEVKEMDGMQVLDVAGEIDVYTAPQFKDAVNNVLASGQKHLIINMENVSYMDSSGFGALLSATKRLRPQGGTVNLVKCSGAIDRILRITRLNTVFATFESIPEAIEAGKNA
ncbi:MAG: STAS domain-containing protein [Armatimonadota bacterium]|nr:STAS domain-containing protein [bacterium]